MTATSRKLTDLDVEVLRAAARNDGSLYRSERGYDLYSSYLRFAGRDTKVNRNVDKLCAEPRLLAIGDRDGVLRPWLLTDAGRDALNAADKKEATR